jgi:hypothetical protein
MQKGQGVEDGLKAGRQEEWIAAQKGRTARGALRSRIASLKVRGWEAGKQSACAEVKQVNSLGSAIAGALTPAEYSRPREEPDFPL